MFRRRFVGFQRPRKGPLPIKYVLFISLVIFILLNLISLWIIEQSVRPILVDIAKTEIRGIAIEAINDSVQENMNKIDINDLIIFHNKNGNLTFSTNTKLYSQFITQTTKDIQTRLGNKEKHLYKLEDDSGATTNKEFESIVYYIPLGVVTRNSLFANYGPKIPLEVSIVGEVEPEFETTVKKIGINNTYLELFVTFKASLQIVIPFTTEEEPVVTQVKLGDVYREGNIPHYYGDDGSDLPNPIMND
ncbi:sporulation protein YunB [Bacillus massilinigeriensis]|uniref:sporulation protein YunB n=1 Tax=Bacillus massilionigeriensis TaxID=1805475 RepID=UPI00096B48D6|nr:sporulation protein YunB [Bacillus massilionigeriensis]